MKLEICAPLFRNWGSFKSDDSLEFEVETFKLIKKLENRKKFIFASFL